MEPPTPMLVGSRCNQCLSWNRMHCSTVQVICNTISSKLSTRYNYEILYITCNMTNVDICSGKVVEIPPCIPHSTSRYALNVVRINL